MERRCGPTDCRPSWRRRRASRAPLRSTSSNDVEREAHGGRRPVFRIAPHGDDPAVDLNDAFGAGQSGSPMAWAFAGPVDTTEAVEVMRQVPGREGGTHVPNATLDGVGDPTGRDPDSATGMVVFDGVGRWRRLWPDRVSTSKEVDVPRRRCVVVGCDAPRTLVANTEGRSPKHIRTMACPHSALRFSARVPCLRSRGGPACARVPPGTSHPPYWVHS